MNYIARDAIAAPTSYLNYEKNEMGQVKFSRRLTLPATHCTACTVRTICLSVRPDTVDGGAPWWNPGGNKEREGFADAINRAAFGNERVLLRRRGRAVAAVVPIDDLRLLEALEDRIDLVDARAALAQANKKGAQSLDVILKELGL